MRYHVDFTSDNERNQRNDQNDSCSEVVDMKVCYSISTLNKRTRFCHSLSAKIIKKQNHKSYRTQYTRRKCRTHFPSCRGITSQVPTRKARSHLYHTPYPHKQTNKKEKRKNHTNMLSDNSTITRPNIYTALVIQPHQQNQLPASHNAYPQPRLPNP